MTPVILIGGGRMRDGETAEIDKYIVKKAKGSKVVFFPTASKDLPAYIKCFEENYAALGCKTVVIKIYKERPKKEEIIKKLLGADIIYLGGGEPEVFRQAVEEYNLINSFEEANAHGALLAGLSAGAIALSRYGYDPDNNAIVTGIGFAPWITIAHFDGIPYKVASFAAHQGEEIVGIEDKVAVEWNGKRMKSVVAPKGKIGIYRFSVH